MKNKSASNNAVFFGAGWHFVIGASFFGMLSSLCIHICLPPFSRVDSLGPHQLCRRLVEGALFGFIFGRASLHALSVA